MVQQGEGWPLGLEPVNERIGMVRNSGNSMSMSFNMLFSGSPSCITDSSSNFDTESTGSSFIHDNNSITLGSLIGVSRLLELSRRSIRRTKSEVLKNKKGKNKSTNNSSSSWFFCLCSKGSSNVDTHHHQNRPPSLAQFLAAERRVANQNRDNQSPFIWGPEDDEFALAQTNNNNNNTLFVNGTIAPPRSITSMKNIETERRNRALGNHNKWFIKTLSWIFSCRFLQDARG